MNELQVEQINVLTRMVADRDARIRELEAELRAYAETEELTGQPGDGELHKRIRELEAACAAKDAALLLARKKFKSVWLDNFEMPQGCADIELLIDSALSPDAGRDYVPRADLALVREALESYARFETCVKCYRDEMCENCSDAYVRCHEEAIAALEGTAGRDLLERLSRYEAALKYYADPNHVPDGPTLGKCREYCRKANEALDAKGGAK